MKIKRFVAKDMRQAMREVREEQGPDAVILSTRRLADGIEVIAAIDYDEALIREATRHGAVTSPAADGPVEEATAVESIPVTAVAPPAIPTPRPLHAVTPPPPLPQPLRMESQVSMPPLTVVPAPSTAMPPTSDRAAQDTARLRAELGSMREMLEMQLSSLAWNDMDRRQPQRARVLRELTRLGIEADVARALVGELPDPLTAEQARYLPLGMLSRGLVVSGRGLSDGAGVTALVGPTGVGKTTTIAKLAARAVLRHGADQVALISTDHYRIGAAAQLEHYGRLLGVRVYPAHDVASLRKVLALLQGRQTVLVDTAGVAGSDPRMAQQMDVLAAAGGGLRACLVLAANAQSDALEQSVRSYEPLQPQGCILTKLDEAPSLGGALSVLIRHRLPLDYTTDGQRVPEDIAEANARALVCRAAQSLKTPAPDENLMAERFGLAVASA